MAEQWEHDLIRRADDAAEQIIMDHKLDSDRLRDVTTVPGMHPDGIPALSYNDLVRLMARVEDEGYKAPMLLIPPGRRDEIPPEKYDPYNPFHYIQRYGMRPTPPASLISITGRTISDAAARAQMAAGMRRVEALFKGDAGDTVNRVINRDETGRFTAMSGDDQEIQHDQTPAVTSEPVREPAGDAESEAGAVNRNPQ